MQDFCNFKGCPKPHVARGYCAGHYYQLTTGKPMRSLRTVRGDYWNTDSQGYMVRHKNGKRIFQHREIMEKRLGRKLLPTENVHHINGQRGDNRPENLELWITKQPYGQRVEDMADWALEILRLYRPEALA